MYLLQLMVTDIRDGRKGLLATSLICYNVKAIHTYRGIVQRLVRGSPKPEIVVRFHVPLPKRKADLAVDLSF